MKKILSNLIFSPSDDIDSELSRVSSELSTILDKFKDEKEQREAILASMEEGVIVTDRTGTVTLANRKAVELFGSGLSGKRVVEISRNPKLHRIIEEGGRKGEAVNDEVTIGTPRQVNLSVTMTPLVRNNEVLGSVIVFHDITLLKKLETMRIDFVANVSHELKTPLTAIKGFAETLRNGGIDDRENAVRFVDIIENNADRLSRLVDDLLILSNIELGKVTFDIKPVDVKEVADTVVSTLEQRANEKGISLEIKIEKGTRISADKDRLSQVLLNLVDNGIKFTERGSVTLSADRTDGEVMLIVADTGIGIPSKDISRLGERFYRVDVARSRELGGTGLGLAIVKHLVTSMGWKLAIESEPGKGTKVSLTMRAA